MAFSVTNDFAGSTSLTAAELDQNFADIETKINGNLTTANLDSSAGITNSQLANDDFELVLSHTIEGLTDTEAGLNTALTGYFVIGSIPYDATGGAASYTILGIEHMLYLGTGGGGTEMIADLDYGNHTDGWTEILSGIATGTANGQTREAGFTSSISVSSTRSKFFVLDVTQRGVGFDDGDSWCISIKLKRTNGLRS